MDRDASLKLGSSFLRDKVVVDPPSRHEHLSHQHSWQYSLHGALRHGSGIGGNQANHAALTPARFAYSRCSLKVFMKGADISNLEDGDDTKQDEAEKLPPAADPPPKGTDKNV